MLEGTCLCGGVRYEVHGEIGPIALCHCSMCRKASGSAFASNATVRRADLRIVTGAELITGYASSSERRRCFCRVCGSPLYSESQEDPEHVRIRLGALDDDPGVRPAFHFDAESKAPWFEISDALPQVEMDGRVKRKP